MTRFGYVMVTYFSAMGVAIASCISLPAKLLWNASASTPIGFYDLDAPGADSDEVGQVFQFEAGHLFRFEAGRCSDAKSATWERPEGRRLKVIVPS